MYNTDIYVNKITSNLLIPIREGRSLYNTMCRPYFFLNDKNMGDKNKEDIPVLGDSALSQHNLVSNSF